MKRKLKTLMHTTRSASLIPKLAGSTMPFSCLHATGMLQSFFRHTRSYLPTPLPRAIFSYVLLEDVPNADRHLLRIAALLALVAAVQKWRILLARPPPVPTKLLPRRPIVQINFKPDDDRRRTSGGAGQGGGGGGGGGASVASGGASPSLPLSAVRTTTAAARLTRQRLRSRGGGAAWPLASSASSSSSSAAAATTSCTAVASDWSTQPSQASSPPPLEERSAFPNRRTPPMTTTTATTTPMEKQECVDSVRNREGGDAGAAKRKSVGDNGEKRAHDPGTVLGASAAKTTASSSSQPPPLHQAPHDLPDSFAPLLSSSQMEIIHNQITVDLIHAVQVKGEVRLRPGRTQIPLDKDPSRPQFTLDVGKSGCRVAASASVGSDGFSSSQDLDVHLPTTSRSRPMVKDATLTLDPPLALANVAPTLIHFPTLFEDNFVPTLRGIQIVRFALDTLLAFSSFLEKVLWIIETRAQIHLSRVRVMPLYRGSVGPDDAPRWRLSLSFSGHVLLFGWIPVPFINVSLPTFIIPQPHALLEYLLTAQPLASARLRRENIAERRIVLASIDAVKYWNVECKAVATPPAVGVDLTMPGGLTVALEMMHGRDLGGAAARRADGSDAGFGAGGGGGGGIPGTVVPPRNFSSDTLSSWNTYHSDVLRSNRMAAAATGTATATATMGGGVGGNPYSPKPFDANSLVPWLAEIKVRGRVERDKISLTVEKLSARHEAITEPDGYRHTASQFTLSGSLVICKPDPDVLAASGVTKVLSTSAPSALVKKASSHHLAALSSDADVPSVYEAMLYPDSSSSASMSHRMHHLLQYDYAFDIGDDTKLDAFSVSIGATHPMLKGGTIVTTVFESMYAFGSIAARENAVFDMRERRRKRNILRHLPAVDVTAGIASAFIPERTMSYHDDGQTICFPEMVGGRMMIRVTGGFEYDSPPVPTPTPPTGLADRDGGSESIYVTDGIKVVADFGVSSFSLNNESKVNDFPELDIFDDAKLVSLLSGTFSGRACVHLRPQNLQSSMTGTDPNIYNPLEAYEIAFSGSSFSLKIREGSATLGHRRIIIPSETTFVCKVVESVVDMAFEGKTECDLMWDFQGNSPVLQSTRLGLDPADATLEDRDQVPVLIPDLRQGRLIFAISDVGGISFKKAATSRAHREGLYSWKFFNALVSPDEESPKVIMKVLHDKRTMEKMLQVIKLINSDLERALRYVMRQVWRAKDVFEQEGVSDPGNIIPGHRMARLLSLFLCGDLSEVDDILPVIRRVVAGEGLDIMKVKDLLHKHLGGYDSWAPEIDRAVRWADVMLGPMMAPGPYIENYVPPLCELPCYATRFTGIPSAKELYSTLLDKTSLPLDPSFSNLVGRVAPYLSFQQVEYALKVRNPSDWQPSDLRRLRYVYSVKKKVLDISESYGGLSFLPQSFFVSVFLGEATRASLRFPRKTMVAGDVPTWPSSSAAAAAAAAGEWGGTRTTTTLSTLRRRRARVAPYPTLQETGQAFRSQDANADLELMSPAGRVASQMNMRKNASSDLADAGGGGGGGTGSGDAYAFDLGDSLLGPQDVAILLQAGLTSSMKGSTVVQLNQRMLLDLMASQPRTFAVSVLAEIGMPGGHGSPRGLTSALMALLELDQSSFTEFHRLDMHALLESWLPGFKIPRREDYLAGGRWARQSYYEALSGVAKNLLEDAESYMALKRHVQRVRHNKESDPVPLPKELASASCSSVGFDIDSTGSDFFDTHDTKLGRLIALAKERIETADRKGNAAMSELIGSAKAAYEIPSCVAAISSYQEAFQACSNVLRLDKLAFQADWFKSFFRRNYDALMIKSVYDNIINDVDKVRHWMDALRNGARSYHDAESAAGDAALTPPPPSSPALKRASSALRSMPIVSGDKVQDVTSETFFANPEKRTQQELVDAMIDSLFYYESEREVLRADPLVRLLISNPPGEYNFTIITAMGVITEGKKGLELQAALERLEKERGVKTIRSDTGTARSFEFNASKIEEAIDAASRVGKPFGLLGYSQGCANVLMAESLMISGTPHQQQTLNSPTRGLVCRQLLFSAANGSMHGPASDTKVQRLIVMGEEFFKYQQGYCSRAFISTVLEMLNGIMDSAPFHKFIGGAQSMLPDGCKAFWRDAQHLPHVTTCVLRAVLESHTTPESLEMITNLLTKQSGSPLHDSQVHVYDAIGHPVYTKNRNGTILERCDMGGSVQRSHHWSPLSEEVEFVKTKRDDDRASFDCAKDRHVYPWVDVNARFGIIKYARRDGPNVAIEEEEEEDDDDDDDECTNAAGRNSVR